MNQKICKHIYTFNFLLCVSSKVIFSERKQNYDCSLQTSKNGIPAGAARDVQAECKYQSNMRKYYYEISWKSPKHLTPVSRYRIFIMYDFAHRFCFQVSKSNTKFEFDESVGFIYGRSIKYAVTPQPVIRVDGRITIVPKKAVPCPVAPKLLPLPNEVIPIGSNFSFECNFVENPVPNASISWLFTKDKTNCDHRRSIQTSKYIKISKDKQLLEIINANKEHVGCYILIAENGVGTAQEQKGYLDLNMTTISLPKKKSDEDRNGELMKVIGYIIGTTMVITINFRVVMYICFRTKKNFHVTDLLEEPVKKVYISHCTEEENDKNILLKFASIIKSFNIDVIIDLCSKVSINSDGGLPHWIPGNMKIADKIMVVLTSSYLIALQSYNIDNNDQNENTCKVHSEYNFINNILFKNCQISKHLVIISNGVKRNEFPPVFENKSFFQFPTQLNIDCDEDLDDNFRGIIGVLLEKEPHQLPSPHKGN